MTRTPRKSEGTVHPAALQRGGAPSGACLCVECVGLWFGDLRLHSPGSRCTWRFEAAREKLRAAGIHVDDDEDVDLEQAALPAVPN